MQAIILVGGRGTRLRSVVSDVPKPLAPIGAGKTPFLHYLLKHLADNGISEVFLAVGYMAECFFEMIGKSYLGMKIYYSHESRPLGTGGAIKKALDMRMRLFPAISHEDPVFVLNGDCWHPIDYYDFWSVFAKHQQQLSMALTHLQNQDRFGRVGVNTHKYPPEITSFEYQSGGSDNEQQNFANSLISCGIYLLYADLLLSEHSLSGSFSIENDFFKKYIQALPVNAYINKDTPFVDIGIPQDYQMFVDMVAKNIQYGEYEQLRNIENAQMHENNDKITA